MSPSQVISSLGGILSKTPSPARYVLKTCASLLSRQLLRPEGVLGLCVVVFGEGEDSDDTLSLDKLEHIAKLLNAVPTGMKPKVEFPLTR